MKKKAQGHDEDCAPPVPKVATSMKGLLAGVKVESSAKKTVAATPIAKRATKPTPAPAPARTSAPTRPSEGLRGHERTAYFDAMAGVRAIGASPGARPPRATALELPPAPSAPETREADRVARERLAALVSGGVHFEIRREEDWVAGIRRDAPRGVLERLADAEPASGASIDLHGARAADVDGALAKFLRLAHKRGVHRVRVVHGKGLHSDAGGPVLGDAVLDAITKGIAAAHVLAFVTAPSDRGGSGALLIELVR